MFLILLFGVSGGLFVGTILDYPIKSYEMLSLVAAGLLMSWLAYLCGLSKGRRYEG